MITVTTYGGHVGSGGVYPRIDEAECEISALGLCAETLLSDAAGGPNRVERIGVENDDGDRFSLRLFWVDGEIRSFMVYIGGWRVCSRKTLRSALAQGVRRATPNAIR